MSTKGVPLKVLLVEDSEDDRFFFQHAFTRAQCDAQLSMAKDGIEGIELLQKSVQSSEGFAHPDVIFLDLKMPDCDGFDVLRWMRDHALLETIKVYVLSGSSEPQDISLARELGATDYLVKPIKHTRLQQLLQSAHAPPAS
jgi:CheY-like chemotaxis protein